MKPLLFTLTMGLAGMVFCGAPASANKAQGEQWETELTIWTQAQGAMRMPAQLSCQAVQARDPRQLVPQLSEDCPGVTPKVQGSAISWSGTCRQGTVRGEMRFIGSDRLEGQMQMQTREGAFRMEFKGRKLGRCTPGEE